MRFKFDQIAINSTAKKKPVPEDAAHYIGLEHLIPGTFDIAEWGSEVAPVGEKLLMKKGDVLFGRRRAYQRKVGIAPFDGIFSAHGMVLRPRSEVVDEKYFPFFISSDQFMNEAVRISVGSLSPTINWGTLKNCEFDLPPMDEQKKLAELLWAANDLKESYKKAITATDEMLKAKFREMFGDVGDDASRGEAEARSLSAKNVENAKSKWPMICIGEIGRVCMCKRVLASQTKGVGDVPFYKISTFGGVADSYISYEHYAEFKHKYSYPKKGDVLLSAAGTIGRCVVYDGEPAYFQDSNIVWIDNDETKVTNPFLFVCYRYISWQTTKGGIIERLYNDNIRKTKIPLPPLSLQREFVAIADKAESAKANLKKSIAAIDQVMKGLINH